MQLRSTGIDLIWPGAFQKKLGIWIKIVIHAIIYRTYKTLTNISMQPKSEGFEFILLLHQPKCGIWAWTAVVDYAFIWRLYKL